MEELKTPVRTVRRYSLHFKQKVVEELESGKSSIEAVRRKYGILGPMTIPRWVKQFGKSHLLCHVVRIETPLDMDEKRALKLRIKELEQGLAQTQLDRLKSESYLSLACEQLGVGVEEFKKKLPSQPRPGSPADRGPNSS